MSTHNIHFVQYQKILARQSRILWCSSEDEIDLHFFSLMNNSELAPWMELWEILSSSTKYNERRWAALFGLDVAAVNLVWTKYHSTCDVIQRRSNLLLILMFLKTYPSFDRLAVIFGLSTTHVHRIVWAGIVQLAQNLDEVFTLRCYTKFYID